jgi:hypothetical protein
VEAIERNIMKKEWYIYKAENWGLKLLYLIIIQYIERGGSVRVRFSGLLVRITEKILGVTKM